MNANKEKQVKEMQTNLYLIWQLVGETARHIGYLGYDKECIIKTCDLVRTGLDLIEETVLNNS